MATTESSWEALANDSDEDLMLRVKTGDERAQYILDARYKPVLWYIVCQVSNEHTAEDILQETWKSIWEAISHYEPRSKFKTYFFTVLNNKITDHRREEGRDPTGPLPPDLGEGNDPVGGHQAEVRDCRRHYLNALTKLSDLQQQTVLLRCSAGFTLSEIAKTQKVEFETAKSRLRYGLQKVRKFMPEECVQVSLEDDLLGPEFFEDAVRKDPGVQYDEIEPRSVPAPPQRMEARSVVQSVPPPPAVPYNPFHPITREEIGEPYSESEWAGIYRFIYLMSDEEQERFRRIDEMNRATQEEISLQPHKLSFLKRLINRLLRRS